MDAKQRVTITRSLRGWSVHTETYWGDDMKPANTFQGANTLAWALWQALDGDYITEVLGITVKGAPVSFRDALEVIEQAFTGTQLKYRLPHYRNLLKGA